MEELQFVNLKPEHASQIAALQRICFPNTDPAELFAASDMRHCATVFPEGIFVVLDGTRVVGLGAGIFLNFDFDDPQHTLHEIAGPSGCDNHDPDGDYYYGTDISVHPDYRRRGIGGRLYELRKAVVRRYNKKGIVAGGMIPGYANHRDELSAQAYVEKVVAGELYDPTLTFQLQNGFEVRGLLENYFHDAATGSWATLIVWNNPEYRPGEP